MKKGTTTKRSPFDQQFKGSNFFRNNQNPSDILMAIAAFSLLGIMVLTLISEGGAL